MSTIQNELLAQIERFIAETGISATKFGENAVGDGHLVHRLRRNESITLKTAQKIREHIAGASSHRESAA